MKRASFEICAYCPKLCRHVCPVAVGSARESTTPTAMMTGVLLALDGILTPAEGYASAALCTSCGKCTEVCLLNQPVRDLLAEARGAWGPRIEPALAIVEGAGPWVAVECDERRWSEALARQRGVAVARFAHHGSSRRPPARSPRAVRDARHRAPRPARRADAASCRATRASASPAKRTSITAT